MICSYSSGLRRALRSVSVAVIALVATQGKSEIGIDAAAGHLVRLEAPSPVYRVMEAPAPLVLSCMLDGEGVRIVGLDPTRMEGEYASTASWIVLRVHSQITDDERARTHQSPTAAELTGLLELIAQCRARYQHLPVVMEALEIPELQPVSPTLDPEAPDVVRLREELLRAVSAFSISRTMMILDPLSTGAERRWLIDRYPNLIDAAGDRPIFYRTAWGWRCLRKTSPDRISEPTEHRRIPLQSLTDSGISAIAVPSRDPASRTPDAGESPISSTPQLQVASVRASDTPSTTPHASLHLDAELPSSTGPADQVASPPGRTSRGSKGSGPKILGSGGVAGSFSGAPLKRSDGLASGRGVSEAGGGSLSHVAEPAGSESNADSSRARDARTPTSALPTGTAPPDSPDSRSTEPPAPSPPLQGLPELPTWEPDDHQLVIPITPADSLSPTAPRFVAPRPEFATDMDGWTDFTPLLESDSRIMYVAADGNDSTALVYAPHDAQIGDDPMHPLGSVRAFATFQAARSRMRDFKADWILFRRGDVFTLPHGIYSHGTNPFFRHAPDGPSIRKVFGAYGPVSDPRPIILSSSNRLIHGFAVADLQNANSAFVSLDLRAAGVQSDDGTVIAVCGARNLHFEDCRLRGGNLVIPFKWSGDPNTRHPSGIVLRRCVVVDAARASGGHIQGLFLDGVEGCILEECVFDRNGYIQDPTDPSTWTAKLRTDNRATDPMPSGDGVQPHRTWFSRNLYLSSYSDLYIRGCILSRSASSHQMRVGGVAERNVFIWNDQALAPKTQGGRDWLHSQTLQSNLVLHEDHLLAQALQQGGLTASVGSGHEALVHDNVVTGFNRAANYAFAAVGIGSYRSSPSQIGERVTFTDNVAIADRGTLWMIRGTAGVWGNGYTTIEGSGNIGVLTSAGIQSSTTETIAGNSWRLSANKFFGGAFRIGDPMGRQVGDLRFYQDLGFESGSTSYHDLVALAAAAGWRTLPDAQGRRGWERDIVSYMQSIDSNYVVDETVTVDAGVPLGNRRSNAPQVWRLLAGLHSACNAEPMPEEQAKLTARRYHAFLTFIERARANRKGAWDPAYTADSLNNYIRAGFAKPAVSGEFRATLPH